MRDCSMRVTFGWRVDNRQGPLANVRFNASVVGRQGFLDLVELHLGLAGPKVTQTRRVAAYLRHLRQADDGHRFYSESLKVDDVGVASELLHWRDQWLLHGWNGSATSGDPQRVADMATVETMARDHLPLGEAERLSQLIPALGHRKPPFEEVVLLDEVERLPMLWQTLLALLPTRDASAPVPMALAADSCLGILQSHALAATHAGEFEPLTELPDDGTVEVWTTESVEAARHWLAIRPRGDAHTHLLLCENSGGALDDVFRAQGAPACGFDLHSEFRPALQALPLALELLWKPADPHRVLEFLAHPYGPFRRRARRILGRAFSKQPGLGGDAWMKAKRAIGESEDGAQLVAQAEFWFESERWSRDEGAPIAAVRERADAVARSFHKLLASDRDDLAAIGRAIRQVEAFVEALEELQGQGIERLRQRQVEQLLKQSTSAGTGNPSAEPEVNCRRSATLCALAGLEPATEVLWWMPSQPYLPAPHPWSALEVEALDRAGTRLADLADEVEALSADWLRPLLGAQERFVLVLPPTGEEEHPFWLLLERLAPSLPIRSIEQELKLEALGVAVPSRPLPRPQRYLAVPANMTSRRTRQSYTALATLFDNPAVSVLQDAANLREGELLEVAQENRLLGTLAHRLVERLFAEVAVLQWDAAQVRAWFQANADVLVEAEGAPLVMLGLSVTLHRFKEIVQESAVVLLRNLQSAGVVGVRTEVEFEGTVFDGVPVVGKVDLLAELSDSRFAVIDLKWTGRDRFRQSLTSGTFLQVAFYAELVEQNLGSAPVEVGYFIFTERALLVTTPAVFPDAEVCAPPPGTSVKRLLATAESSWLWRRSQLDAGVLEVVDPRCAEVEEYQGPDGTLPVSMPKPWDLGYLALLGWEVGA